ncbi:HIT family protein [Candidatus Babeliales bacterium]|nr:HIT family protein [Candidatus Babeliales bacterium]
MKKLTKITLITFISLAITGASFTWWQISTQLSDNKPCLFCNHQILETHRFYEDNLVMGLCNHKPIQPGHCMAVTKRHIERFDEITNEEFLAIGRLLKKTNLAVQKIYGPSAYIIHQKNGAAVGQTVPHVHFHYIPKKKTKHKKIAIFGLLWSFVANIFKSPISMSKLRENVILMKRELTHL